MGYHWKNLDEKSSVTNPTHNQGSDTIPSAGIRVSSLSNN